MDDVQHDFAWLWAFNVFLEVGWAGRIQTQKHNNPQKITRINYKLGLCKLVFTWWRHRLSAPSFERIDLLLVTEIYTFLSYIFIIHTSTSDFVSLRRLYQVEAFRCLAYSGYKHRVPDACSNAVPANVCRVYLWRCWWKLYQLLPRPVLPSVHYNPEGCAVLNDAFSNRIMKYLHCTVAQL